LPMPFRPMRPTPRPGGSPSPRRAAPSRRRSRRQGRAPPGWGRHAASCPQIGVPHRVRGADSGGRTALQTRPVHHHGKRVGHRENTRHVVLDQQQARGRATVLEQRGGARLLRPHAGQRLVQQQHARAGRQRHGDFQERNCPWPQNRRHRVLPRSQARPGRAPRPATGPASRAARRSQRPG
jgi:hypothetical protein